MNCSVLKKSEFSKVKNFREYILHSFENSSTLSFSIETARFVDADKNDNDNDNRQKNAPPPTLTLGKRRARGDSGGVTVISRQRSLSLPSSSKTAATTANLASDAFQGADVVGIVKNDDVGTFSPAGKQNEQPADDSVAHESSDAELFEASTALAAAARNSYKCRKCGVPKRGHTCEAKSPAFGVYGTPGDSGTVCCCLCFSLFAFGRRVGVFHNF